VDPHCGLVAAPLRLAVYRATTETAIEACEAAWDFFGGAFKVVIPDDTKAIVDQADPLGACGRASVCASTGSAPSTGPSCVGLLGVLESLLVLALKLDDPGA
jgi:hypothetical protein